MHSALSTPREVLNDYASPYARTAACALYHLGKMVRSLESPRNPDLPVKQVQDLFSWFVTLAFEACGLSVMDTMLPLFPPIILLNRTAVQAYSWDARCAVGREALFALPNQSQQQDRQRFSMSDNVFVSNAQFLPYYSIHDGRRRRRETLRLCARLVSADTTGCARSLSAGTAKSTTSGTRAGFPATKPSSSGRSTPRAVVLRAHQMRQSSRRRRTTRTTMTMIC